MAQTGTWHGAIVRIETFSGDDNGKPVAHDRVDRWTDLTATDADEDGAWAYLEARWSVRLARREGEGDCALRYRVEGEDLDPTLSFDVGPFDDLSYALSSTGDTDPPSATGTMSGGCPSGTAPFPTTAPVLPQHVFAPPAGDLPPGVAFPGTDDLYGPGVWGVVDPDRPDVLAGVTRGELNGTTIVLSWSLDRSGRCDDDEARLALATERARAAAAAPPAEGAPGPSAVGGVPLSLTSVPAAVVAAGASTDAVAVTGVEGTDAAGLARFALRLGADGSVLPSLDAVERTLDTTCVAPGSLEAARALLVGSVQWTGDAFRVDLRKVDVETGGVLDAVGDRGVGDGASVTAAVRNAVSAYAAP